MPGPTLRLVCVNDVYALDNLPRLATLVREAATVDAADAFAVTLAGDFLGPSLLASLDGGAAMVACMNAIGFTHVCFGNHEADVPAAALAQRIREFGGTWLNSNLAGFAVPLPEDAVIDVAAPGGRTVRVGLVGVLAHDPSLYRPGVFGGATILPANDAVFAVGRALVRDRGCTSVIALTHQSIDEDRLLAGAQGDPPIPVVVGGHEHEPYVERFGGAWIVKAGTEASHAAIIDLAWPERAPAEGPDVPSVTVRLEPVAGHAEDAALRALVDQRSEPVRALAEAALFHLPAGVELSSVGARVHQTSVGTFVASKVRDALGADACVLNGGGIRGGRTYRGAFSYGDLEGELPFANEVVTVPLPGRVLRNAINVSRSHAPEASPGFLQVDDGVAVDPDGRVLTVAGAPLDDARVYRVATVRILFEGLDHVGPLIDFARSTPSAIPPPDRGRELKMIVVEACSLALWSTLGAFDALDANGDAQVSRDELRAALERHDPTEASTILVDGIVTALDRDHDRRISRDEAAPKPSVA